MPLILPNMGWTFIGMMMVIIQRDSCFESILKELMKATTYQDERNKIPFVGSLMRLERSSWDLNGMMMVMI